MNLVFGTVERLRLYEGELGGVIQVIPNSVGLASMGRGDSKTAEMDSVKLVDFFPKGERTPLPRVCIYVMTGRLGRV